MKTKISIIKNAIQNLSPSDQNLFEKFGLGLETKPSYHCIYQAIEAQAKMNPDGIAVRHFDETITYQDLDQRANQLAAILQKKGIQPGDHVALFLQRSIPMIVGILATLKVRAAYVPQHVGVAPTEQLKHILKVSSAKVILTLSYLQHLIPAADEVSMLCVDDLLAQPLDLKKNVFKPTLTGGSAVCFVLFTSGTTGKPNGVQVTHGNVCNVILTAPGNLGIRPGVKVSQILSIAFDMAAWEILGCLSNGGTLVIRGKDIAETVQAVDVVIATPTILSSVDANSSQNVKVVAVAGEPCPRLLADTWSSFCDFYNSCGPTETTIVNTMQLHSRKAERLTIGTATPNNSVYILDENKIPCAIGEVGEMWAGGACVSKSYLNNPELTSERYVADPFLGNGKIMFRTRDLGRWTLDGQLEHFGSTDDQVKIRGFRVELDSVSAALESVSSCQRAVTLKLNDRNLVAFVRPKTVDISAAKQAVMNGLPYYCTPSLIFFSKWRL